MPQLIKYNSFAVNIATKVHDFSTSGCQLMVCLTNTTPDIANHNVLNDVTQIPYTNVAEVYPADVLNVGAESPPGVYDVSASDLTVTASGGAVATFRYAVLYDATPTTPLKPLLGYWDYGIGGITLADTQVYNIAFGTSLLRFF